MPIVRIASTSSVSFIVPICAANALPDRPATMIAVISTPSSRSVIRPTRFTVSVSAPNCESCTAPCCAMTMPMRKLISPMIGSAATPTSSIWRTSASPRSRKRKIAVPSAITVAPREAENSLRAASRSPGEADHASAEAGERVRLGLAHHRLVGADLHRRHQPFGALAGTGHARVVPSGDVRGGPRADRVDLVDAGKIDLVDLLV